MFVHHLVQRVGLWTLIDGPGPSTVFPLTVCHVHLSFGLENGFMDSDKRTWLAWSHLWSVLFVPNSGSLSFLLTIIDRHVSRIVVLPMVHWSRPSSVDQDRRTWSSGRGPHYGPQVAFLMARVLLENLNFSVSRV